MTARNSLCPLTVAWKSQSLLSVIVRESHYYLRTCIHSTPYSKDDDRWSTLITWGLSFSHSTQGHLLSNHHVKWNNFEMRFLSVGDKGTFIVTEVRVCVYHRVLCLCGDRMVMRRHGRDSWNTQTLVSTWSHQDNTPVHTQAQPTVDCDEDEAEGRNWKPNPPLRHNNSPVSRKIRSESYFFPLYCHFSPAVISMMLEHWNQLQPSTYPPSRCQSEGRGEKEARSAETGRKPQSKWMKQWLLNDSTTLCDWME